MRPNRSGSPSNPVVIGTVKATRRFLTFSRLICVSRERRPRAGRGARRIAPTVDPELTVAANLRFHTRLHGLNGARTKQRIETELARVDLNERAGDYVRTLSGGNRRWVELARALLHDPQIPLMDEPTVGLDPQSRRDMLDYVLRLCGEKYIAVLWATHLVDEAEMADRIIVLHRGHVLRDTSPSALVGETGCQSLYGAFLKLTAEPTPEPPARARA